MIASYPCTAHVSADSIKVAVDVEAMFNADISRAVKKVFEETSAESNVIEEVMEANLNPKPQP